MEYNYYIDSSNNPVIPAIGGATSRLTTGYGSIQLCTGANSVAPTVKLSVENNLIKSNIGYISLDRGVPQVVPGLGLSGNLYKL